MKSSKLLFCALVLLGVGLGPTPVDAVHSEYVEDKKYVTCGSRDHDGRSFYHASVSFLLEQTHVCERLARHLSSPSSDVKASCKDPPATELGVFVDPFSNLNSRRANAMRRTCVSMEAAFEASSPR